MSKRLVIAGGGHAHMVTLARLAEFVQRGCEVTVVGPADYHYYSGMGPGMLGGTYALEEIRFATRTVVENSGARFERGRVERIDPVARQVYLDSGATLPYDLLSCNLGSQVPGEMIRGELEDVFLVKPIERLLEARQRIIERASSGKIRVGIVGGGPSAVEIAGNVWRLGRQEGVEPPEITVFAGSSLMPHHPEGVRQRALASLRARGIEVTTDSRVALVETGRVTDTDGRERGFEIIFVAVGVKPSRVFKASGIPTGPDGGLLVNSFLQSSAYPEIFGGGDCIYFQEQPLDKVGVYAVRQNPVLCDNLLAALEGGQLRSFDPGGGYLLIFNLGDGTGIFHKWAFTFGGRLAFTIKDHIDRKFMREFQAIE